MIIFIPLLKTPGNSKFEDFHVKPKTDSHLLFPKCLQRISAMPLSFSKSTKTFKLNLVEAISMSCLVF